MLVQADEEFAKRPAFDFGEFAGIRLVCKYVRPKDDSEADDLPPLREDSGRPYAPSATMRIFSLARTLKGRSFYEFVRRGDDGSREVHVALFEAAAVIPFADGATLARGLRVEALRRKVEIDVLDQRLPDEAR